MPGGDMGFRRFNVNFGQFLVFADPFAVAEMGTGGLVVEV